MLIGAAAATRKGAAYPSVLAECARSLAKGEIAAITTCAIRHLEIMHD